MKKKIIDGYFLILFSLIPISIILGSGVSVANILLIDISFLIFLFFLKDFSFLKDDSIKFLLIFCIYLIINSLISIDSEVGYFRNLGFFRMVVFFVAINYFFNQKIFLNRLFLIWFLIIFIVVTDVYFERLNGTNLLGYPNTGEYFGKRIVSFFKDEPIVGGFLNAFYLIIIGFFLDKYGSLRLKVILLLSLILLISILITGERANFLRALTGIFLFFTFYKELSIRNKIIAFAIGVTTILVVFFNSEHLKGRFQQFKWALSLDSQYFQVYKSGLQVFKNYPILGVGNKNYRVEVCENPNKKDDQFIDKYRCITHPHQIYLEFLSEHGILGTSVMMFLFYKLIFSKIMRVIRYGNYIQLGSLIYLLITFLPLIPSGSFFNDYMLTLFIINLSIFYASNINFNIFKNKNNDRANNP